MNKIRKINKFKYKINSYEIIIYNFKYINIYIIFF